MVEGRCARRANNRAAVPWRSTGRQHILSHSYLWFRRQIGVCRRCTKRMVTRVSERGSGHFSYLMNLTL